MTARFLITVFYFWLFLGLRLPISAQNPSLGKKEKFQHFYLRYFSPHTRTVNNIFKEDDFFHLDLFDDRVFMIEAKDGEIASLDLIGGEFPELNLLRRYYYDSLARSRKKIMILLFGTLWDSDTIDYLRDLSDLYRDFSREKENQNILIRQCHQWFKTTIRTEYLRSVLNKPKSLKAKDWQAMQSAEHGFRLYHPDNVFVLFNKIVEILAKIAYEPDVTFAFVAVSADEADAQALLKDEDIPIPFVDDADATITSKHVPLRVPTMVIVNHKGYVDYRGDVLPYLEIRSRLDSLLYGIFEQRGRDVEATFHDIRMRRYQIKVEKELKKQQANKAEKKYGKMFKGRKRKKD
jgi:hypothetical protein